jgi:hypothetical protein
MVTAMTMGRTAIMPTMMELMRMTIVMVELMRMMMAWR